MRRTSLWLPTLAAMAIAVAGVSQAIAQSTDDGAAASGQAAATGSVNPSTPTTGAAPQASAQPTQSQPATTAQAPAGQATAQPQASAQLQSQQGAATSAQAQPQQQPQQFDQAAQAQQAGQAQLAPSADGLDANLQTQADLSGQAAINQQPGQQQLTQQQQQLNQQQLNQQQLTQTQIDQQLGIQFNQAADNRLAISSITPNSVFFNSGLLPGDALISVAGRPIASQVEFVRFLSAHPAQRIPVVVLRNGVQQTVFITRPANFLVPSQQLNIASAQHTPAYLGVTFDSQVPNAALLRVVAPASPAEKAGLQPGDIITALDGRPIASPNDAVQTVGSMSAGQQVVIDYSRQQFSGRTQTVLAARPAPVRHSVGYAPQAPQVVTQPVAPLASDVQIVEPAPRSVLVPDTRVRTFDVDERPLRPGDADRDGRIWDGDGRIPLRARR